MKERGHASFAKFAVGQVMATKPQVGINWHQAAGFCNWLSKKAGLNRDQWCYELVSGNYMRVVEDAVQTVWLPFANRG